MDMSLSQIGRERALHILDGREAGDDERERRHLAVRFALRIGPGGVHGAAVLAHGD